MSTHTAPDVELPAWAQVTEKRREHIQRVTALLDAWAEKLSLPADERIAWTLRYVERHRLETVAVMMDCSLATAKRRIARAQRFLTTHFVAPYRQHSS